MTAITYTALRDLAPGHTAGTEYTIDVPMSAADRERKPNRTRHRSLSGVSEHYVHHRDVLWHFTTEPLPAAEYAQVREFLASVDGGEAFTIDPYGTTASPDAPFAAELESEGHRDDRHGSANVFSASFSVRAI